MDASSETGVQVGMRNLLFLPRPRTPATKRPLQLAPFVFCSSVK